MQQVPQTNYANSLFEKKAGSATDKDVSAAIMQTINELLGNATNVPDRNAQEVEVSFVDHKADTRKSISDVQSLFNRQQAGSISIVLLGETHTSQEDKDRANAVTAAINDGTLNPDVIVYERGLTYTAPTTGLQIVRESNLTSVAAGDFAIVNGLSAAQRSMIVAGYLVLIVAGGDQNSVDKIMLYFGANHDDIFRYFTYFARHSKADYLLKRPTTAFSIRSNVK